MQEHFTELNNLQTAPKKAVINATNIVEHIHADALAGESPEDVHEALSSVGALQDFRRQTAQIPFASFHELVEGITNLNRLQLPPEEKDGQIKDWSAIMLERVPRFSPRVADLYQALIYAIRGESYQPHFEKIQDKMTELKNDGDLEVLFSDRISWDLKLNRIKTRLVYDYLLGLKAFDKREGKEMSDDLREWREEQLKKAPTRPPWRRNESQPGVDPMERLKEGERVPAIWSIAPAWGGYYKEQSFSRWDETHKRWVEDKYIYSDVEAVPFSGNKNLLKGPIDLTISSKVIAGTWVSLPVPYTHDFNQIETGGKSYSIQKDQNGDLVVFVEGRGKEIDIVVTLSPAPNKKFRSEDPSKIAMPQMPAEFSKETIMALEKINDEKRGNIARARVIRRYVLQRVQYLAPKDHAEAEYYNNIYRTSPKGFAGAVDELEKGDCDVVNTYFAALCAKLDIPIRHCVGHSVKGKNQEGVASINVGTGHAWSEVWDEIKKEWIRMDATPVGDPNLEEDDQQKGGGAVPGDYGAQEAVRPSDEQLEKLRQKLAERKEQLSYTKEERQLAEGAGVDLKEARQIVKEIHEAEKTTLPNGELVTSALSKVFNLLIESRKTLVSSYTGPVRQSEGGEEIMHMVSHYIQGKSGEADPASRELPTEDIKEEKLIGGFDVYFIGDKSGSMQRELQDERLWQMQRRAAYLIFSSLHQFERDLERTGIPTNNALSIRTQGISFRGGGLDDIDLDKPLSTRFTDQDKVKMWHSLTTQGSGNGDVAALSYIYRQIQEEIMSAKERGGKGRVLRIVIACSDGAPDDPTKVQDLAQQLGRLGAVVIGIGLTDAAAAVPIIFNTSHSCGDIAYNINNLPAIAAKHIVGPTIELFPEKTRETARELIKKITQFKNM